MGALVRAGGGDLKEQELEQEEVVGKKEFQKEESIKEEVVEEEDIEDIEGVEERSESRVSDASTDIAEAFEGIGEESDEESEVESSAL